MIEGYGALQLRLHAIGNQHDQMGFIATIVVGQLRRNIVHKTSGTSRTIHVASISETSARIEGSAVALWLDTGTGLYGPRHQKIVPRSKKALRWIGGPSGSLTLAGRQRTGKAGAGAGARFAKSVKGMKARPYIQRSIREASDQLGVALGGQIIDDWNKAA